MSDLEIRVMVEQAVCTMVKEGDDLVPIHDDNPLDWLRILIRTYREEHDFDNDEDPDATWEAITACGNLFNTLTAIREKILRRPGPWRKGPPRERGWFEIEYGSYGVIAVHVIDIDEAGDFSCDSPNFSGWSLGHVCERHRRIHHADSR